MATVRHLEIPYGYLVEPIRITASMGIARLRVGETAVSWIERADRALYIRPRTADAIEVDPIDLDEACAGLARYGCELSPPAPSSEQWSPWGFRNSHRNPRRLA
jgi:GGDEF domain-containing protein